MGRKIGNSFKDYEEIQIREIGEDEGHRFFRIRAIVDVSKPIKRSTQIIAHVHGKVLEVLKYEQLPHLCFYCGRIGHTIKLYSNGNHDFSEEDEKKYAI